MCDTGHSIIAQVTSRDISQSRHSSLLPFDSLSPNDDIQLFLSFPELSCIIAKAIQLNYLFKRLKFQSNLFCNLAYRIAVWRMIHGWSRNWNGVQRGIEISILPREQIEMSVQDDLLAEMKRKKLKTKKKTTLLGWNWNAHGVVFLCLTAVRLPNTILHSIAMQSVDRPSRRSWSL